jgi:predicted aconitase
MIKVGEIQGYDVIYVPERNQIFCKNTSVNFDLIERIILKQQKLMDEIKEKNLTITKNGSLVTLGCLTTTLSNCKQINKTVKNIRKNEKK